MRLCRLAFPPVLVLVAVVGLLATQPQMGVSEIRPGMVGIGRTVFAGTKVEEFRAHIIGVLENVIGTRRNLILAKLEGGPLAQTGVIAGMSGSPVYIDGRLIGAVSYSMGQFSKEPIAGITPIAEMTDATASATVRPQGARVQIEFPLTPASLRTALQEAFLKNRPFAAGYDDARLVGASGVDGFPGNQLGALFRPIATPLFMSGFGGDVGDLLGSAFGAEGFVPAAAGAGGAPDAAFDGPLKPGDAVGVSLVSGDVRLGGTGTVTEVDGDRVYAFGHPFYNLGPTEFPMTRAFVYTVLPSLISSMKLSSTGDVIGTFTQDRATAIAGRLGPAPRMIPVSLTLDSARAPKRTFQFNIVNDQLFTPLATYVAILNTLGSYERQMGAATFAVSGSATLKGHETLSFENLFSGDQAAAGAAAYVVAPLAYMLGNDFEKVDVDSVNLTVTSEEQRKTATLERVWIDDPRPRAGRRVPVKVLLRSYRGEDIVRSIAIDIPANITGPVALLVSDGARLAQLEQREARLPLQPRSITQAIRTVNKGRRNSTLYIKLLGTDAGAVVNGERLSALPPSVLGVLEADRNGGNFNPLQSTTLGEWELPTGQAVSGARTLSITVSPN